MEQLLEQPHQMEEESMVKENKKDATKSVAWLAIDKETQEKLISIRLQRLAENLSENNKFDLEDNFQCQIHCALGMKSGDYRHLNRDLQDILGYGEGHYEGGIYDEIRNYLEKFEAIESAVRSIADKRINGASSDIAI